MFVDSDGPSVIDASAGTSVNDNPVTVVMFTKSNLDPSQEHTINVSYVGSGALGGPYAVQDPYLTPPFRYVYYGT